MRKILFVVSTKQVILTSIEWSCFRGYPLNLGFDTASSSRKRVSSILVQNDNINFFAEASDIQEIERAIILKQTLRIPLPNRLKVVSSFYTRLES